MGIEKKTTEINGQKYEIETFGAKQGMAVFLTLIRFVGPSLAEALANADSLTEETLGKVLATFAATAKPEDFTTLLESFSGKSTVVMAITTSAGQGENRVAMSKIFDSHFAGNYPSLIRWFVWAVTENFRSFFAVSASELTGNLRTVLGGSPSPKG